MKKNRLVIKLSCLLLVNICDAGFFENSRRRVSTIRETRYLAKVEGGTGFFVQNTKNRPYLATAKHLFKNDNDPYRFCRKGGRIYDYGHGIYRTCKRVIAETPSLDLVILEFDGSARGVDNAEKTQQNINPGVQLAKFSPRLYTRLKMIGHPGDNIADGAVTTTENCWVLSEETYLPYQNTQLWRKGWRDPTLYYNCSIYFGNSGGSILIEGSDVVVGLPGPTKRNGNDNFETDSKRVGLHLVSAFVSHFEQDLLDEGIAMAHSSNQHEPVASYFKSGKYLSMDEEGCRLGVNAHYESADDLVRVKVESFNCTQVFPKIFQSCIGFRCFRAGVSIESLGDNTVSLSQGGKDTLLFIEQFIN
jgi:hypothetical protein